MKKTILCLICLLLLTGCKAKYELKINLDDSFVETGNILIDSNLLGLAGHASTKDEFLEEILETYNGTRYRLKTKINENNYFGYKYYDQYGRFSVYQSSPLLNALYNNIELTDVSGYITLKTSGSKLADYTSTTSDFPTKVEEINISITLPYKVINTNATTFDAKTNTYKWIFTSETKNDNIELSYRKQLYSNNPLDLARFVSPYIYVASALIIIIIVIIIFIRSKLHYINKL